MLSVILATIASMIIGSIWFSPKTFYPIMQREMDITKQKQEEVMKRFKPALYFSCVILSELILASIIYALLFTVNGNLIVILLPIVFVTVSNIKTNIFTFLNLKLFLIQEGEKALSIFVMGLIISLMM